MSGYKWTPKPRPAAPRPYTKVRCGTRSGLNFHYANKEDPCRPCLDADNKYQREHYAATKKRTARMATGGSKRLLEAVAEAYEKPRTNR